MGTSEFYRVVEELEEVSDSLVVDVSTPGGTEGKLWLFVVVREGFVLDDALRAKLRAVCRQRLSPRHVPDEVRAIALVPRTLNGKKMEVPIKRILMGQPVDKVVNKDTLSNPEALKPFLALV